MSSLRKGVPHSHADDLVHYALRGGAGGGGGGGSAFVQDGNSFGAVATLGTNDLFPLAIETGGVERGRFDLLGNFTMGPSTPGTTALTLNGGGATANDSGTLILTNAKAVAALGDVAGTVQFRQTSSLAAGDLVNLAGITFALAGPSGGFFIGLAENGLPAGSVFGAATSFFNFSPGLLTMNPSTLGGGTSAIRWMQPFAGTPFTIQAPTVVSATQTWTLPFALPAVNDLLTAATVAGPNVQLGWAASGVPANAFVQNGNSFGALATLGTNDAFPLAFETSGVERGRFDLTGSFILTGGGGTVTSLVFTTPNAGNLFTVRSPTAGTATATQTWVLPAALPVANDHLAALTVVGPLVTLGWVAVPATAFVQNGNTFGTLATLGTNDAFPLAFETSGVERGRFDLTGSFILTGGGGTVTSLVFTTPNAGNLFTVQSPTAGTATATQTWVLPAALPVAGDHLTATAVAGPLVTLGWGAAAVTAFVQDGNSFGTLATLGTNDAFPLAFETFGVERARLDLLGNLTVGAAAPAFVSPAGTHTVSVQGAVGLPTAAGVLELANPTTTAAAGDALGEINFVSPDSGASVPTVQITGTLAGAGPNFGGVFSLFTKKDGSNSQNSLVFSQTAFLTLSGTGTTTGLVFTTPNAGNLFTVQTPTIATATQTWVLPSALPLANDFLTASAVAGPLVTLGWATASSAVTLAGDANGPASSNIVTSITGAGGFVPVAATGAKFRWAAAAVNVGTVQLRAAAGNGSNRIDRSQAAAIAGTNFGANWDFVLGAQTFVGAYNSSFGFGYETVAEGTFVTGVRLFPGSDSPTDTSRPGGFRFSTANSPIAGYSLEWDATTAGTGRALGIVGMTSSGGTGGDVYVRTAAGSVLANASSFRIQNSAGTTRVRYSEPLDIFETTVPLAFVQPSAANLFRIQAPTAASATQTWVLPVALPAANDVLTAGAVAGPQVTLTWTAPATNAFVQNGNSFGGVATLGTNDAFALAFETNNIERARFDTAGNFTIGASTTAATNLTVNGGGATATSSGNLILTNAKAVSASEDQAGSIGFRQNSTIALPGDVVFLGGITFTAATSGAFFIGLANAAAAAGTTFTATNTWFTFQPGVLSMKAGGATTQASLVFAKTGANFTIQTNVAAATPQTWILPLALPAVNDVLTAGAVAAPAVTLTWAAGGGGAGWLLLGNAGTSSTTNFVGTTDNVDLVFRRQSIEAGRLGVSNTSFGLNAGDSVTSGLRNTSMGVSALTAVTTTNDNTAFGFNALLLATVAELTAVGSGALDANTTGLRNTAVGFAALSAITTNGACTAVGHNALVVNTAVNNTAVGAGALDANTTGNSNVAIGTDALGTNIVGNNNVAVGSGASPVATGSGNTAIGKDAAQALSSGANNAAVGLSSLQTVTTGAANTAIGASAFSTTLQTGAGNTGLGAGVSVDSTAATGRIAIGINSALTSAAATIDNGLFFHNALATVAGTAVQYAASGQMGPIVSSQRFKENIEPLEVDSAKVFALRSVSYDLKPELMQSVARQFGFIAEEVAEVLPEIVPLDAEGLPFSVNYDRIVVLLLEELRKLRDRVALLESATP